MLFLKTRGFVLGLAAALLWSAGALAQAPDSSPAANLRLVQMKIDFVTVSPADLDKSGVTFDRVPLAPPTGNPSQAVTFLRYVTGDAAVSLFQMLAHARSKSVQAPLITTTSGVSATVQVNTQVPDRQKSSQTLQTGLIITPRINTDDSITLYVGPQTADADTPPTGPQETTLRTIRSGDMMVVDGLPLGGGKTTSGEKMLVFIRPVLIGTGTGRGSTGRPVLPLLPLRETSPAAGQTISMDVFNADLRAVVAMLGRQTQLKASVQNSDSAYKPVDVHLNGASLSEVLGAIARSAGAQIIRDEHGVYVFSPLPGAVLTPKAPVGGGESVTAMP